MAKTGITEKRLANKRFKKTEEAILRIFFEEKDYISICKMAERAGIARSTVYKHHRTVWNIASDYENYILAKYKTVIGRPDKLKYAKLKNLYRGTLVFILQNRQIFKVFIKSGRRDVFEKMIFLLKLKIESASGLPKNSGRVFKIYTSEVVTLLVEWGLGEFQDNEMEKLLVNILYLTETMRVRLVPLLN